MPEAVAINRNQGLIFLDDGSLSKMQHFVDRFGDETDDMDEAISAIAPLNDGRWLVIDLRQFETDLEPVLRN